MTNRKDQGLSPSNSESLHIAQRCIETMLSEDRCSRNLGITLLEISPGRAKMTMTVREDMLNGHDICHGGMIFTLADSTFACACNGYDRIALALGVNIEFLHPCHLHDQLTSTALEKKRGKTIGVYDIEVVNQDAKLVALFRGKAYITQKKILNG